MGLLAKDVDWATIKDYDDVSDVEEGEKSSSSSDSEPEPEPEPVVVEEPPKKQKQPQKILSKKEQKKKELEELDAILAQYTDIPANGAASTTTTTESNKNNKKQNKSKGKSEKKIINVAIEKAKQEAQNRKNKGKNFTAKFIDDNILPDLSEINANQIQAGNTLNSIILPYIPTEEIIMKRKLFIANISRQIINMYSLINMKCSIELFGSCALRNDIVDSDMDLVVNSENANAISELGYIFKSVRKYLYKNFNKYEVHFIKSVKHPIIKIEGDIKMDISYGSRDGVEFVNYIENYTSLPMSLVLYISRVIKVWSKQRKLLKSNAKGMSNYCWLIIILFYANQYSDLFWFVVSLDRDHFNYAVTQILFIIFANLTHVDWSIYSISQSVSAYKLNLDNYQFVNNRIECVNPFDIEDEEDEKEDDERMEIEEEEGEEEEDDDEDLTKNISSKISVENPKDRYNDLCDKVSQDESDHILNEASRAQFLLALDCSKAIEVMFNPPINITIPPASEIKLTVNNNYLVIYYDINEKTHYLKEEDVCGVYEYNQEDSIYLYERSEEEKKINKLQLYMEVDLYQINEKNKYFIDPSLYSEIYNNEYNIINDYVFHKNHQK